MIKVLSFILKCLIVGLLITVLLNAAKLEADYMEKYESAYYIMVNEHEQQLMFSECIQSQHAWEQNGRALTIAYEEERIKRIQIENHLKQQKLEWYTFMRVLEQDNPGILEKTMKKLGPQPTGLGGRR